MIPGDLRPDLDPVTRRELDALAAKSPCAAAVVRAIVENYDVLDALQDALDRKSGIPWGHPCPKSAAEDHDPRECPKCQANAISAILTAYNEWSGL